MQNAECKMQNFVSAYCKTLFILHSAFCIVHFREENPMDNNYDFEYDWDDQYYGTGPTQPPKNHGGLIALMLCIVIFLTGIITVLGILNIRMFQELKVQQRKNDELSIAFTTEATHPAESMVLSAPSEEIALAQVQPEGGFSSMSIQPSPEGRTTCPWKADCPCRIFTPTTLAVWCPSPVRATAVLPPVPV